MRRWIVAGMLGVIGLAGCNRGADVPEHVEQAFAQLYPDYAASSDLRWELHNYGYEASFYLYEAEFSRTGEWLETEYELGAPSFPPALLKKIRSEHPGAVISKYEIEITPEGMFFEVEVEKRGRQIELYYDSQGNPAKNSNEDA